jgi:sigma-B regulation protein RsbU (phosphoserine phosphatase)
MLLAIPDVSNLGWAMDAVYLPAAEVGGDFYAVFETTDGGRLLVVGDVSGGLKGRDGGGCDPGIVTRRVGRERAAPAGPTVEQSESDIAAYHDRWLHHLPMRSTRQRRRADAGQRRSIVALPQWKRGKSAAGDTSGHGRGIGLRRLPDRSLQGETITFLSDGVVEARDTKGGLLGFDRTQELSTRPAMSAPARSRLRSSAAASCGASTGCARTTARTVRSKRINPSIFSVSPSLAASSERRRTK